jgi:hypothetical protein
LGIALSLLAGTDSAARATRAGGLPHDNYGQRRIAQEDVPLTYLTGVIALLGAIALAGLVPTTGGQRFLKERSEVDEWIPVS